MDEEEKVLRWTCLGCGWSALVPMPGFAGTGDWHTPTGDPDDACGPLVAKSAGFYAHPGEEAEELERMEREARG